MNARAINITGRRFGRLLVLKRGTPTQKRGAAWECICDCGQVVTVHRTELVKGSTVSCGCYRRENAKGWATRHGATFTPTYKSWSAMKSRCALAASGRNAKTYRDRGISVCERWKSFENFLADMGERPEGKTLDRIDVDGNYEPSNCRWATPKQQSNNRRDNVRLSRGQRTLTVTEWANEAGLDPELVRGRLSHGWTLERSLTEPNKRSA